MGRLTRIEQSGTGVEEKRIDIDYTPTGRYADVTRYADLAGTSLVATTSYTYDDLDRLTDLLHRDATPADIAAYTWTYDDAGRITAHTSPDDDATFTYDNNGQLTDADHDAGSGIADEAYAYDAAGNRTASNGATFTTGDDNRLTSDGTYDYTYDDEGNRLTKTTIATGEAVEYTYDHRNRLTDVVFKDDQGVVTKRVRYTYDPNDLRIATEISADGDTTYEIEERYILDGGSVALVLDNTDAVTHRYVHGPTTDMVLAEETVDTTNTVQWFLADHQGSVRDVIDNSGTSVDHIVYDSFGNIASRTSTTYGLRFGYTGRKLATEAGEGMWYNRRRFYDSTIGRFVTQDPSGFNAGDVNLYRYVSNSPLIYTDPTGYVQEPAIGADALLAMSPDELAEYLYGQAIANQIPASILLTGEIYNIFSNAQIKNLNLVKANQKFGPAALDTRTLGLLEILSSDQYAYVTSKDPVYSRTAGLAKVGGGILEILGGVSTSWAGVGIPVIAHGGDTTFAGLRQIVFGGDQRTLTEISVTGAASGLGASDQTAAQIGFWTDFGVGFADLAGTAPDLIRAMGRNPQIFAQFDQVPDLLRATGARLNPLNYELDQAHVTLGMNGSWPFKFNNVNWKSTKQFGHTFIEHGAKRNVQELVDRARGTGTPQGQWIDNERAADFLANLNLNGTAHVQIPSDLGRLVMPDGSIVEGVEWARVVLREDKSLRSAFPVEGPS